MYWKEVLVDSRGVNMKKTQLRFYLVLSLIFLLISSCGSSSETSDDTTVNQADGGSGIGETKDYEFDISLKSGTQLDNADLLRIGNSLGVDLAEGWNYFYDVNGVEVQVNWILPDYQSDLLELFHALFAQTGQSNAVLLGEEAVYEVITDDTDAAIAVLDFLFLAPLQYIKIIPQRIYGEGMVTWEEVIIGRNLTNVENNLGFEIDWLINQEIELGNVPVRVNYLIPSREYSVQDAWFAMKAVKGTEIGLYMLDDAVIEIVTDRQEIADQIIWIITRQPVEEVDVDTASKNPDGGAVYLLEFTVVPIINADYMLLNECSIALGGGAGIHEINEIDPALYLGDTLQFFTNEESTLIETNPDNTMERVDDSIAVATIEFGRRSDFDAGDLDVEVYMEVYTGRMLDIEPDNFDLYIEGTDFWPVGTRRVQDAVDDALEDIRTSGVRGTVEVLHGWVRNNIDYGGEVIGSRRGTNQVLRQSEGRCWDHSDVFISMARTAGIPARQIAGWLYEFNSGHIWSQVWLEDEGIWLDVDTTATTVGVDDNYIPIWGTRDGEMLFLYKELPNVQIVP